MYGDSGLPFERGKALLGSIIHARAATAMFVVIARRKGMYCRAYSGLWIASSAIEIMQVSAIT